MIFAKLKQFWRISPKVDSKGVKTCTTCREEKDVAHFPPIKKSRDGLDIYCKQCKREYMTQYKKRNAVVLDEKRRARYLAKREESLAKSLAWQQANKERANETKRRWLERNPDKRKEANARWRAENRDAVAEKNRRWQNANRERANAKNRRYQLRHPEKQRAINAVFHARRSAAGGGGISPAEWRGVLAASLGMCVYCGGHKRLSLDHIDPVARGGTNDVENVAAACRNCNSSKNATPLVLWMAKMARRRAA